ncbi:MAG: transporter permease [Rhodospirillales bacterium]|nr:transporter permease [Rhodospirillales bacterium]
MAFRLQRLPSVRPEIAVAAHAVAIGLAFVVGGIAVTISGHNAFTLAAKVLTASFGSEFGLEDFGLLFGPLMLTGLAAAVTLRIGLWNIGAEGQFYIGAVFATGVGLFFSGPPWLMLTAMFLAGGIGGALWILVPTLARAYANVNEIITTLLLNFVAVLVVNYLSTGLWRDRKQSVLGATARIPYEVPNLSGSLHAGILVAVAAVVLMALLIRYTRWGYEVRISGANIFAAHYAGIPVRSRLISVMLISGAIAGIAGMLEVAGTVHRLQGGISNNFGYLGIIVAVLAGGSPIGVVFSGFVMAVILNAGIILQAQGILLNDVLAMTGLILFFTAIGEQVAHYRIVATHVVAQEA